MERLVTRRWFPFILGAIGALGMPPFYALPALILAYSGFAFLFIKHGFTPKHTFIQTYLFAFGYHVAGLWWISNALLGQLAALWWAWPLALLGLPALLALFPAVLLALTRAYMPITQPPFVQWLAFTLVFMLAECARSTLFTGLPWNLPAMVWLSNFLLPVAQSASVLGVYGLSLFTLQLCAAPALLFLLPKNQAAKILGLCVAFVFLFFVFGWQRLHSVLPARPQAATIAVVQPNVTVDDANTAQRAQEKFEDAISLTQQALNKAPNATVIWPETMLNQYMLEAFPKTAGQLQNMVLAYPNATFLTGYFYETQKQNGKPQYHNAIATWNAGALAPTPLYSKFHLVPFGEYMPFENIIPLTPVTGYAGFAKGRGVQTISLKNVPPFRPLICYEVIFPAYSHRQQAEWLLTVADDSWYKHSTGPYQHLAQAQMRAIEQGLPIVRSTSNGISAVTNAFGQILTKISYNHSGIMVFELPPPTTRMSIYSLYGNLVFYIYFGIIALILRIFWRPMP